MHLFPFGDLTAGPRHRFCNPDIGKLSDIYGRRIMLAISLLVYLAGAILCAVSETFIFFIGARVILALGQGAVPRYASPSSGTCFHPPGEGNWTGLLQIPSALRL